MSFLLKVAEYRQECELRNISKPVLHIPQEYEKEILNQLRASRMYADAFVGLTTIDGLQLYGVTIQLTYKVGRVAMTMRPVDYE